MVVKRLMEVVNLIWKYRCSVAVAVFLVITCTVGVTSLAVPTDTTNPPGEVDVFTDLEAYNYPPNEPSIDGPSSGYVNESYSFTIVATDNDGDAIKYFISWGDGTTTETDFLPNGTSIELNHSWSQPGNYTISVKAYDNNTYSGEVKWKINVSAQQLAGGREDIAIYLLIAVMALLIMVNVIAVIRNRKEMEEKTTQPKR